MLKYFSFLKDTPAKILFLIFVANIFYDDPTLYFYKRIMYTLFIYYALWEIIKFYYETRVNADSFKMPAFYNIYVPLIVLFIIIALSKDLVNPTLNMVTLLNNPYGLLCICPIFLFVVGANEEDITPVFEVLMFSIFTFALVVSLPIFGKVKYYQGYISAYAFIPFFFISNHLKKYQRVSWALLLVGLFFSNLSDYRIIAMRILLFLSLYVGFTICKKVKILKLLIIILSSVALYLFLANLSDILYLFKGIIGVQSFDDVDTRAFLWTEVFEDMKGSEFIFGKGIFGTYFSEYFLMIQIHFNTFADHYERFALEVGFLQLLLKGGFFWYFLYITPMLYSSMKGIFWYYQDKLVFSISIFLFTDLLLMFIENIPYFSFQYSLLFFLAGFSVRRMKKNDEVQENVTPIPLTGLPVKKMFNQV